MTTYAENLFDGDRVLPVLLDDLRSASHCIDVAMFLFFDDPITMEIQEILCAKARAGVAVRVLLNVQKTRIGDPFSTGEEQMMEEDPNFRRDPTDITAMCERLRAAGVHVLDTHLDFEKVIHTGEPHLDQIGHEIRETSKVDAAHIDHRKIVTVDGRVAYCGSANFGAQYLFHRPFDPTREARDEADEARKKGEPEPWWKWHDGFVRFEGPIVHDLAVVFRERWLLGGGYKYTAEPAAAATGRRGIRVDGATIIKNEPSSRPNGVRLAFVERIRAAERSIFIENPYFYHPAIVKALLESKRARPALRVTLIYPGMKWNDNRFAQDAGQHLYRRFLDAGIEIFEYQHHFTHLKLATFDERLTMIGSANLNYRSLEDDKDFECNVLVEGEDFARDVNRHVRDVDILYSKRITRKDLSLRMRLRSPVTLAMLATRQL